MDNAGENIAVAKLCKINNITIEYTPPDTPKLNNMVERGFAIRWEIAKTLMQNAGLKNKAKMNKRIMVEVIQTACFLMMNVLKKGRHHQSMNCFLGSRAKTE